MLREKENFDARRTKVWKALTNDVNEAIGSMLKETLFVLCKVLCRHFHGAKANCL
jgi:hypothetical protein